MTPAQRKQAKQRYERFDKNRNGLENCRPAKKKALRAQWQQMPPEHKRRIRDSVMSPNLTKQQQLRQSWKNLTPQQRRQFKDQLKKERER